MARQLGKDEVLLMNAGHRERQSALAWWKEQPFSEPGRSEVNWTSTGRRVGGYYPFWKMLEEAVYDAHLDRVTMPNGMRGEIVTFQINDWYGKVPEHAR